MKECVPRITHLLGATLRLCLVGEMEKWEDRKIGKEMEKWKDRKYFSLSHLCLVGGGKVKG